jgi:hypothetical protein
MNIEKPSGSRAFFVEQRLCEYHPGIHLEKNAMTCKNHIDYQ